MGKNVKIEEDNLIAYPEAQKCPNDLLIASRSLPDVRRGCVRLKAQAGLKEPIPGCGETL